MYHKTNGSSIYSLSYMYIKKLHYILLRQWKECLGKKSRFLRDIKRVVLYFYCLFLCIYFCSTRGGARGKCCIKTPPCEFWTYRCQKALNHIYGPGAAQDFLNLVGYWKTQLLTSTLNKPCLYFSCIYTNI